MGTRASASTHDVKNDDVVYEVDPVASGSLGKEKKSATRKIHEKDGSPVLPVLH